MSKGEMASRKYPREGSDPRGEASPSASLPWKTSGLWFPFFHVLIDLGIWKSLSKKASKLYPVICKFADFDTGECYPSLRTLSKLSGIGLTRIREAVDELVAKGLLTCQKGDSQRSNRYKVVRLGVPVPTTRVPDSGTPSVQAGSTPGPVPGSPVGPPGAQNYTQLTITKVTSTKNNSEDGGGLLEGAEDLIQIIAGELGLKKTGVGELESLLSAYGVEWVDEAFKESVRRGKVTLRYMEGILKNWRNKGRAIPKLKGDADREFRLEHSAKVDRERVESLRRAEEGKKAFELVEQTIAKLSDRELTMLKAQAEIECEQEAVPGVVRDAMVKSKMRQKVAQKYGIAGF
jgi:DnaD/phage-associated family protein